MKIFGLILYFVITSNAFSSQKTASDSVDNFQIHMFLFKKQVLKKPLLIFDNPLLSDKPVFTINSEKIIDHKNNDKEYFYKDHYKENDKIVSDDEDIVITVKDSPFSFITKTDLSFVIPIQSNTNGILKIQDESLYFKVAKEHLSGSLEDNMVWRSDKYLRTARAYIEQNAEYGKFMNELSRCVKAKDEHCLFSLHPKFKTIVADWTNVNDKDLCAKHVNGDVEINTPANVNWNLFKDLSELQKTEIKTDLTITRFGQEEYLTVQLGYRGLCGGDRTIILESGKINDGKTFSDGKKSFVRIDLQVGGC